MKITTKGQVTIPQALRERFAMGPHAEVVFEPARNGVLIKPAHSRKELLDGWIRTVRGRANAGLSTREVMRLTRGES